MSKTSSLRRINIEIKKLEEKNSEYEKMFKISIVDDNIYHLNASIYGPDDSLYEGYIFKLDIRLSDNYPFSAPQVKFLTPIQHVNINKNGDICLDILGKEWSSSQNINSILLSIILLLSQPNPLDPLNSDLASLYRIDKNKYIDTVKEACKKNAMKI